MIEDDRLQASSSVIFCPMRMAAVDQTTVPSIPGSCFQSGSEKGISKGCVHNIALPNAFLTSNCYHFDLAKAGTGWWQPLWISLL